MSSKEHVILKHPSAIAEQLPRIPGKKKEFIVSVDGKRLGRAYSEPAAWKEAMLKIHESTGLLNRNVINIR